MMPLARTLGPLGRGYGSAAAQVTLLLQDDFSSGTLSSPRTCVPGPGTLTIVDTGGKLSLSSGKITVGTAVSYFTDPRIYGAAVTRAPGLAIGATIGDLASYATIGFTNSQSNMFSKAIHCIAVISYLTRCDSSPGTPTEGTSAVTINHSKILVVLRSNGAYFLGYNVNRWELLHRSNVSSASANTYPMWSTSGWSNTHTEDNFIVAQMVLWATDAVLEYSKAAPVAGDLYTAVTANYTQYVQWTPQAGEQFEMMCRRGDDNNCWILRCSVASGTVKLISKVGGVETERNSYARAFVVGTQCEIMLQVCVPLTGNSNIYSAVDGIVAAGFWNAAVVPVTNTGCKIVSGNILANWQVYPYIVTGNLASELNSLPL